MMVMVSWSYQENEIEKFTNEYLPVLAFNFGVGWAFRILGYTDKIRIFLSDILHFLDIRSLGKLRVLLFFSEASFLSFLSNKLIMFYIYSSSSSIYGEDVEESCRFIYFLMK